MNATTPTQSKHRKVTFETVIEAGPWPAASVTDDFVSRVTDALGKLTQGHITYVFTDDAAIRILNRDWRRMDKPTNVLSFPDGDESDGGVVHLGDVIVAYETLVRESVDMGIPFNDHLTHLLLHGSLHLLGYDHIEEADAEAMESLEIRILERLDIKNPYQDGLLALD